MSKTDKREKMYKPGKMYNLQQVGKHRGFIWNAYNFKFNCPIRILYLYQISSKTSGVVAQKQVNGEMKIREKKKLK
jgi:hypothetical protein